MAHVVIYVPGLGDTALRQLFQGILLRPWRLYYGIRVRYFAARWQNTPDETFDAKLKRLLVLIDAELAKGHDVSLVGASAGASLALNALFARSQIVAAVSICGKLRNPQTIAEPVHAVNPAFRPSIERVVATEPALSSVQRAKILLVRPLRDAVVPLEDNWVGEAAITRLPTFGHGLSIIASLTFFSGRIVRFIRAAKSA